MKLNKNGWGLLQMLWMMGIIFFFFLLAIILIVRFYHSLDRELRGNDVVTEKMREQMSEDLETAAERYIEHNYKELNDVSKVRLTSERLFQAGLFAKDLYAGCRGYTISKKDDGVITSKVYIKCHNYKTPGYDNN